MKFLITVCSICIVAFSLAKTDDHRKGIPTSVLLPKKESLFPGYKGLVMAGYQGWFTAEGDNAGRGWHHYQKSGKFEPGFTSIDFWPDVSKYAKTYNIAFKYANGEPAKVYSSLSRKALIFILNG